MSKINDNKREQHISIIIDSYYVCHHYLFWVLKILLHMLFASIYIFHVNIDKTKDTIFTYNISFDSIL